MEFSGLNNYPSFSNMEPVEKEDIVEKINDVLLAGITQKWYVDHKELNIEAKPFAQGSNSSVFNCVWRTSNIVIKNPKTKKIQILKDLLREIEIWSTLRHPNLVQFLGASFDFNASEFYILMEKIPGTDLGQLLTRNIAKDRKRGICKQLIDIVSFLHNCGPPVIFRDLKPDNVLVDIHFKVKLTDFGLSRFVPTCENFQMTGGTGTVRYMAPEVYLNKPYDLRADIYSLGMIFYYIYTQIKPFAEYTTGTIHTYFITPDLLLSTNLIKNKKFRHIVNKCIDKNKESRWSIKDLSDNFNYNPEKDCAVS